MKLNVQHLNLRSIHELDSLVEDRILALQPRLQIDEANVRLECRSEESPAYRVAVHLVTPGPDLLAEGRDHTLRTAIRKALLELEDRFQDREHKSIRRVRSNLQTPAALRAGPRLR